MVPASRKNAALIRRFLTDVIAGGDIDAVDGFLANDAVDHNLVFGADCGREAVTALGWRVLSAADIDLAIEEVVATDDRVAARGTVAGTHRESLMDLAPTGRSFEIAYAWFFRLEDGQIVEIHSLPDGLGLMRQLGALPELPSNGSFIETTDYP